MIPLAVPNLAGNEARYLLECIETTFVSSVGPFVDQLEGHAAQATGSAAAVATCSGTSGLHLALTAAGVGSRDLVIIPTFTFIATANAVSQCGATPWLMDIDTQSWTLDPELLACQLELHCRRKGLDVVHTQTGARVAAVMPVYTLGTPADLDQINQICDEWGIPVVADAAAAVGSTYKHRSLGSLARATVLSFNGNKTVTCGGGGAVVSDDLELMARIRHLSTTARAGDAYDHDAVGFNYRMTNLQAAVGCAQFERLNTFLHRKREVYAAYASLAKELVGCSPFPAPEWAQSAHWFSGILLPERASARDVRERLRSAGIDVRPFWKPVHLQAPYASSPRSPTAIADDVWERVLVLPSSSGITNSEMERVITSVRECIAE